ncbi:MAG: M81 family metallopeptidase [Alphaproteobacteria bacterium]|nr:M81 family metallopeptidase [Alphaproteobacteria bacterium]
MKIVIASFETETNTFSPLPTGVNAFHNAGYRRRDASLDPTAVEAVCQAAWRRLAARDGHTIVESVAAFAQPAGRTVRAVYERLRDDIIADVKAAMPVDMVLLLMHGAMVAEGYDDCEGDTIARIRAIVGPDVPIGLELDLHCHITRLMMDNATAIITFKEYPHIDYVPRAEELYELCARAAAGAVKPVMALHDCRMINMWRTPVEPMKSFVARMQALEGRDGILSVSFGHGFPWGDTEDVGAKMLVIADGDRAKAEKLAAQLAREIWALRHETATPADTIDLALDRASAVTGGPIVLADVADNAGGGAPGDSTFILRRILDRGLTNVVSGCYWDPIAVQMCIEAGEGATFELRIGGKCGRASGDPVDLTVTVRKIVRDLYQTGLGGRKSQLGDSVWVSAGGIDLVLTSVRSQVFHPDAFTAFGIDPAKKALVVVKSTQHFYAGFAPLAKEIRYVTTPGAIPPDFANIPFTKLTRPYWPRVEDPFAGANRPA